MSTSTRTFTDVVAALHETAVETVEYKRTQNGRKSMAYLLDSQEVSHLVEQELLAELYGRTLDALRAAGEEAGLQEFSYALARMFTARSSSTDPYARALAESQRNAARWAAKSTAKWLKPEQLVTYLTA